MTPAEGPTARVRTANHARSIRGLVDATRCRQVRAVLRAEDVDVDGADVDVYGVEDGTHLATARGVYKTAD